MKSILNGIKLASSVSQPQQNLWAKISKRAIRNKQVEPLSEKGVLQVVAMIAYTMATECYLHYHGVITNSEWEYFLEEKTPILDDIHYKAALASGIHPDVIDEMLTIVVEQYNVMYDFLHINQCE